jgi:hypothetical protein
MNSVSSLREKPRTDDDDSRTEQARRVADVRALREMLRKLRKWLN